MIQPSSPTPHHLLSCQLSFLDQIAPQVYNPFVMFYKPEKDSEFGVFEISNKLKKSMSHVLTLFYPLTGRLKEKNTTFVESNNEGIPYLEARVNCQLSHFLQNPSPNELNKLIPFESDKLFDVPIGVQLNIFKCVGIAIRSCISHKVADGLASFMFLKNWAAIARGDHMEVRPEFQATTLFPPKSISVFDRVGTTNKDTVMSKRFVLNAAMIKDLKGKYAIINRKGSSNH
ncbi:Transferase [Parasponia andersonii]|uniref:Transferase n=1 Tax=Parasponia andersonii TaxID=3476 RepID=A0A2P5CUK6_PARAD|nr:Transferase [Parasponia andersonii]